MDYADDACLISMQECKPEIRNELEHRGVSSHSVVEKTQIGSGFTAVAEPIDVLGILKLSVKEMDRFPMTDDGFKLLVLARG